MIACFNGLASLGPDQGQLAICTQRGSAPIDLELIDEYGYFSGNTIEFNQLITGTAVLYDVKPDQSSEHLSIVGQLLSAQVASVRMTWQVRQ